MDDNYRAQLELEVGEDLELDVDHYSDKRLTRRCEIEIPGVVNCNGLSISVTTKDLSLKSVCLKMPLPKEFRGKAIQLKLEHENKTVVIKCTLPENREEFQVLLIRQTKDMAQLRAWLLAF